MQSEGLLVLCSKDVHLRVAFTALTHGHHYSFELALSVLYHPIIDFLNVSGRLEVKYWNRILK